VNYSQRLEVNKLIAKFLELNPAFKDQIDIDSYNKLMKDKEELKNKSTNSKKSFKSNLNLLLGEWNKLENYELETKRINNQNSQNSQNNQKQMVLIDKEDKNTNNLHNFKNQVKSKTYQYLLLNHLELLNSTDDNTNTNSKLLLNDLKDNLRNINSNLNKELEDKKNVKSKITSRVTSLEEEEEKLIINRESIIKDLEQMFNDPLFAPNEDNEEIININNKLSFNIPIKYQNSFNDQNQNKIDQKETIDGTVSYYPNGLRTILSKDKSVFNKVI